MCGIAGIYLKNNRNYTFRDARRILSAIHSRGPEGEGTFSAGGCSLFHTRLGIIAPDAEAAQPMEDISGRWKIVFNGEILNYKILREDLRTSGVEFRTESDTEVLLQGYIHEGLTFLNKLRGFFAFSILDVETGEVFLARDHAGIKPFFFAEDESAWYWGSTTEVILKSGFRPVPDLSALRAFLEFHFIPPEKSMWAGMRPLPTGGWIKIENKQVKEGFWFSPESVPAERLNPDILLQHLETAVRRNLVSDVPAGIFLSGGLDSGVLGEIISRNSKEPFTAFCLGFQNTWLDETAASQNFAREKGWHFKSVHLEKNTAEKWLDKMPEPVADPAAIGVFRLSEVASEQVKMVISGDGADENFGGYARYTAWRLANVFLGSQHIPGWFVPNWHYSRESGVSDSFRKMIRFLQLLTQKPENRYRFLCGFRTQAETQHLLNSQAEYTFPFSEAEPLASLREFLERDRNFVLPGNMLPKSDLASMANGLELRVPYLDEDLVSYVGRASDAQLVSKLLLHQIWQKLRNQSFVPQKKGFDLPLSELFTGNLKSRWMDMTSDTFIRNQGIFNPKAMSHMRKEKNPGEKAWALLVWQSVWQRNNTL